MLKEHTEELSLIKDRSTSVTKTERYKWNVKDSPGRFAMLNKHDLKVDKDYQRDRISAVRVRDMAADFSWVALGCLIVAHRDGDFWVLDGQHRLLVVLKRPDIDKVPCLVFESANQVAEARGFININVNRRPLGMTDRWNAMIMAGDETAFKLRDLLASTGHFIKPGSTELGAVGCVLSLYRAAGNNFDALRRLWPVIVQVCGKEPVSQKIVQGMMYVETSVLPEGQSLAKGRWKAKLIDAGFKKIMEAIDSATAYYGQAGHRPCGEGIVKLLNHKTHESNRLKMP